MSPEARPTVVLLHGLIRTHRMLQGIQKQIEAAGYATWARTYPSTRMPITGLAARLTEQIRNEVGDGPLIGVTHSLGGILARHMTELNWAGLVMVAPPNGGSRAAAALKDRALYGAIYGKAGVQLADSNGWPVPTCPFAVIAGTRAVSMANPSSLALKLLRVFPAGVANDGTVAVDETRHAAMSEFATVDATHTWIMDHPRTQSLVLHYLAHGTLT